MNEDNLTYLLEMLVDSFNDCACCPLTFSCREDGYDGGIDSGECAKKLRNWLSEPVFFDLDVRRLSKRLTFHSLCDNI